MLLALENSEMVITDSGGLQKEAFFAKKKCLTIRKNSEWTELSSNGSNMLCEPENILHSFNNLKMNKCEFVKNFYGNGNASEFIVNKIAEFLLN